MLKDGNCRALTQSGKDGQYQFIDLTTLLFISHREGKETDEEKTSFYKISLDGGEAVKAFDIPFLVSSFEHISKDRYLLAVQYNKDYSYGDDISLKEKCLKHKKEENDYKVFTKIPFYFNGSGFLGNTITRLYLYNAELNELSAITSDEIDISSALPRWADEKELLLPAMENGLIVPKKYVPQLVRGDFGVMQPEGGPFPIDEIDCIIVPGLGFTLEGARLGRGKGCYDRFLVGTKASKMGLCFSEQILDRLIVEPHDIFMDFVTVA